MDSGARKGGEKKSGGVKKRGGGSCTINGWDFISSIGS